MRFGLPAERGILGPDRPPSAWARDPYARGEEAAQTDLAASPSSFVRTTYSRQRSRDIVMPMTQSLVIVG
jgi:hypothetical protein